MLEPTFYQMDYTLYPGSPSEAIWAEAQAQGASVRFSRIGDVIISIDSRNSYSSLFALRWAEYIGLVRKEGFID